MAVAIGSFVKSHSSPSDSDSEPTKNTNAYPSSDSGISRSSSSEIDREKKKLQESSDDREKKLKRTGIIMLGLMGKNWETQSKLKKSRSVSSILSSSSSRKSLLRCSTNRSSSTITLLNGGLFDDNGAMGSKRHSLTLKGRYMFGSKNSMRRLDRKPGDYTIENAPNIRETKDVAKRLNAKLELK
ncbi:hypothetical protein GBA52_025280 [Prunus armeniaca]|nr:hypothetical protein GBA52_025280 [Prunus armeniaca]